MMDTPTLGRIERLNYILGGVLVVACGLLTPAEFWLGVLVGVVLGSVNFSIICRIARTWIASAKESNGTAASGFFLIPKMGALIVAVFLALQYLPIRPGALAIGFSIFILSIIVETIRSLFDPPSDGPTGGTE